MRTTSTTSLEVIKDCCLVNGAIVAANSDREDYPCDVQNYRYVWPRDAAYICVAADRAGEHSIQENFYRWLINRAEGSDAGLLYQNYYTNGPKRWLGLQIDQNGSILWSIHEHFKGKYPDYAKELIIKLADGILGLWSGDHFNQITQDLWEERFTYPELKQYHTYSLASCIKGLECASDVSTKYSETAKEMKNVLIQAIAHDKSIRTPGKLPDMTPDASMLGLIWPFGIYEPKSSESGKIIEMVEKNLVKDYGVYRYPYDSYCGYRKYGIDGRRGSGPWPLLGFWMGIIQKLAGRPEKAKKYADFVYQYCQKNQTELLPEQIFDNTIQKSVRPLAWSHAMHILYENSA